MTTRLTRAEQAGRNRELVLDAARRVFLARGYAGATVEAIADEAGFSKGVVYSQFDGKADLLLTLLDERIAERAAQNARLVEAGTGWEALVALLHVQDRRLADDADWARLLIEFRVLAARDPELNARYAAAHRRTVDALADCVVAAYAKADAQPPAAPRLLAEFMFAVTSGLTLERAADPAALPQEPLEDLARRLLGVPSP
ncbi:TetR/AcrR family transcriptional regulator [Pseudonocardia benzenivorans]|uniref:TetR/AcrR family transcriptional regulator n=1 Tax=Pseudonocardia benzenivorans TaxID=228005 RepID=A0ABW3VCH7_9PSEU|nr:TetR family transcriptional regulator [Pseudonocardia dioxanivorans]